jgi:hypothetical protein
MHSGISQSTSRSGRRTTSIAAASPPESANIPATAHSQPCAALPESKRMTTHSDTDLLCIASLMACMGLKRTYMQALKHCANERHCKENPTCFTGSKSCKRWIMQWLERNRDFKVTLVYPRRPPKSAPLQVEFAE